MQQTSKQAGATGVRKLFNTVDARVQRHRDSKHLLKQSAADLVDAGWTRHDVVSSRVKWHKLLRQHGAQNLVHTLQLSLSDAIELGINAKELLRMSSDLLGVWNVRAHDMIALGATVPLLLDLYETGQNLAVLGFTSNIKQWACHRIKPTAVCRYRVRSCRQRTSPDAEAQNKCRCFTCTGGTRQAGWSTMLDFELHVSICCVIERCKWDW